MKTEFIDLTYPIETGMLTFKAPWHPEVEVVQMGRINSVGRETRKVSFGSHTGTHIDAPLHFIKGGESIDRIGVENFVGNVTIADFTFLQGNEALMPEHLKNITITDKMIFKFGWGKYWGQDNFYKNYPYFSEEAAEYLILNGVKLLGMDTPSPDDSRIKLGSEQDSMIHKTFLLAGVILLEYLANLDKINDYKGWNIAALPLKIKGSDGAPARVIIYR